MSRILVVPGPWPLPASVRDSLAGRGHLLDVRELGPVAAAAAAGGGGFDLAIVRHGAEGSGGDVVASLKRGDPSLPVIALLRDEATRLSRPVSGADRILVEPVDAGVLTMVVSVLLARSAVGARAPEPTPGPAPAPPPARTAVGPAIARVERQPSSLQASPSVAPADARSKFRLRRKRVIVVDEDHAAAGYMRLVLERRGAEVMIFESARALTNAAIIGAVDMVIVDRAVPGMDGYELLTRLRGDPAFRAAKFLVTSVFDDPEIAKGAIAHGADGYIGKPVRASVLGELFDTLRS